MKYAIVIGDGMADRAIKELGGKTPLEHAHIPNMDGLCSKGVTGLAQTVPEGVPPGSDTAILSIFGYDPRTYYTGRSPLEAAGSGVLLKDGELSYRTNMVALGGEADFGQKTMLSHSGGSVEGEEAITLMQDLQADDSFAVLMQELRLRFVLNPSFRHIGILSGWQVAAGLIPPHDILGRSIGQYLSQDDPALALLIRAMCRAYEVLSPHPVNRAREKRGLLPANCLWFWGEGKGVTLPGFVDQHQKTAAVITAVPLVVGIGNLAGLNSIPVEGATGEIDTNYEGKVAAALEALKSHDLAVVHVEAPDECSHAGDREGKLRAIELLDERVIGPLAHGMAKLGDYRMLILSDHPTLLSTRTHDGAPVPFVLYDSRVQQGSGLAYGETNASAGPVVDPGHELIRILLEERGF